MSDPRFQRDPGRPCFVISVAASLVQAHPRTLRIYEDEGLLAPARTPTNIRLYSENDIRRILWIRRLTQELGVNLAGVKLLFEIEERLGTRLLEALFDDERAREAGAVAAGRGAQTSESTEAASGSPTETSPEESAQDGAARYRQSAYQTGTVASATSRPITRIVATRVTTTRSGDPND
ncbi:MAG: MerR family transcriptional regulator [Candidatus Limnocylindrales bacterium]